MVYFSYVKVHILSTSLQKLYKDKRSEILRQTLQQQVILVPGQTPD